MSTLTSGDFGELKRPTTRVHAPPGGGSSWSIGGYQEAPKSASTPRMQVPVVNESTCDVKDPSPGLKQAGTTLKPTSQVMESIEATNEVSVQKMLSLDAAKIRLAVIFDNLEHARALKANLCNDRGLLESHVDLYEFSKLMSLPYCAKKLLKLQKYDGVVCVVRDVGQTQHFESVKQSLIKLSVEHECPITLGCHCADKFQPTSKNSLCAWAEKESLSILSDVAFGGYEPLMVVPEQNNASRTSRIP